MCEEFVTISQKLNKEKTERYWRKFVFTNNNSVKVAIIILQEPKYMDNQIEPALISAVNFVSKEYKKVYVFNLLPVNKEVIEIGNIDYLKKVMSTNISEIKSVVDKNCSGSSSVDLIYGARVAKCFKDVNKNNELSEILIDTIRLLEKDKKIELKAFFDKDNGLAYTSNGKAVDSVKEYKTDELNSLLEQ
ncbi:hypothetical protein SM120_03950 [Lactococcus lactis subsp. lactis]|uniref:hypothetical protein n=1 Tax=Lactococcus lactis TaxID=1358 RepID=UPI002A8215A9|nr:hypothetical protein [Lactococcus lactis]MDY4362801.1 hypothetical protein [Lactococcus lactis subsp. lactis]